VTVSLSGEIFGYMLTPDRSQEKFFIFQGVTRSEKGTVVSVLEGLLGRGSRLLPALDFGFCYDFWLLLQPRQ